MAFTYQNILMCSVDPILPGFENWVNQRAKPSLGWIFLLGSVIQHPKLSYHARKLRLNIVLKGESQIQPIQD